MCEVDVLAYDGNPEWFQVFAWKWNRGYQHVTPKHLIKMIHASLQHPFDVRFENK